MDNAAKKEITAVEIQVKNRKRRSIFVNGEFAFGVHEDVLLEQGIGVGDALSETDIARILDAENRKQAKEKALRILSYRARSEDEMRKRLREAKFSDEVTEATLETLKRLSLINDKEFALSYARHQIITKPCGEFLLRRELKNKGISEDFILAAIEEAFKERPQAEVARDLARKKKRQYSSVDEAKAKKRTADFLMRRGFSWDIVSEILDNWEIYSL